jgi:hypothetical protein
MKALELKAFGHTHHRRKGTHTGDRKKKITSAAEYPGREIDRNLKSLVSLLVLGLLSVLFSG